MKDNKERVEKDLEDWSGRLAYEERVSKSWQGLGAMVQKAKVTTLYAKRVKFWMMC